MKRKAKKEVGKRPAAKLTEFFQSTSSKGGTPGECEMWNESGSSPFKISRVITFIRPLGLGK